MIRFLLTLPVLLLGACASLKVQVDVMNPAYTKATATEAGLRVEANQLASGGHQQADDFATRTWNEYDRFRLGCLEDIIAAARGATPPDPEYLNELTGLRETGGAVVEEQREATRKALYEADAKVAALIQKRHPAEVGLQNLAMPLAGDLKAQLLDRRRVFAAEADDVRSYIEGQRQYCQAAVDRALNPPNQAPAEGAAAADKKKEIDAKAAQAKNEIEKIKMTAITGGGILLNDSIEAFFATQAHDKYWAPRYNRAFGKGFFGSTSVAIKMNDTADFSIKGFVFDGRSTAEMVRKVGVQSVALVAAAYGAPIGLGKSQTNNSAPPTTFDNTQQISSTLAANEKARAEEAAFRASLFRVADSVFANWVPLVDNGDKMARDIVAGTFTAYKDAWKASSPPKP